MHVAVSPRTVRRLLGVAVAAAVAAWPAGLDLALAQTATPTATRPPESTPQTPRPDPAPAILPSPSPAPPTAIPTSEPSVGSGPGGTAAADVAPPPATPPPAPSSPEPLWAVNFEPATLYAQPDLDGDAVLSLRANTYLQVLGYEGDWALVYDPRTRTRAYLPSLSLGPADAPPPYISAPPPPALNTVNVAGRVVGRSKLAFYPTPEDEAQISVLAHNASVFIADAVEGTDGATWYRTADGYYLPEDAVRLPRAPSVTFEGRWIDADLNEPVMLTAYEDDIPVRSTLAIKGTGAFRTPTGVFSIQRRVASETMNSETIGIPRNGPGGYYLTGVLFTQYFAGTGESIHYNYWSSNFGYAASHGCLGLAYEDSEFLWYWASVGTPVSIHF